MLHKPLVPFPRSIPRRHFLVLGIGATATGLLAACAPAPTSAPAPAAPTSPPATAAPAAPTAAPKPTSAPPTSAPVAAATASPAPAATTAPATAARGKEVVAAVSSDVPNLDPRVFSTAPAYSVSKHITEALVRFDDDMKVVPQLAESWEQRDPTTTRFKLRSGVKFTNGEAFNAQSAKHSLDKVIDPNSDAWMGFAVQDIIKGADAVDDMTLDVHTTQPTPNLVLRMTLVDMVPLTYGDDPAFGTKPAGTGPFRFVSYVPRQQVVLEANPDYWGPKPGISKLTFRILPEDGSRIAALLANEVQMIDNISPDQVGRIKQSADHVLSTTPTSRLIYVALRNDRKQLGNKSVRQALNYAIDKKGIVDNILSGIAEVATAPIAPMLRGYKPLTPYPYDADKAKQMLDSAGAADLQLNLSFGKGRYPNDQQVMEAITEQLKAVGVTVNLTAPESATFNQEWRKEDSVYDAYMQGWSADALDPNLMLTALFNSKFTKPRSFYADTKVDELLTQADTKVDPKESDALLNQAEAIIWDDSPYIWLYYPLEVVAISKGLSGFKARADEFFYFDHASLA